MSGWMEHPESPRVPRLLLSASDSTACAAQSAAPQPTPTAGAATTGYLERELSEAMRAGAEELGIELASLSVHVWVISARDVLQPVSADPAWVRYAITIDAAAGQESIARLHAWLEAACVRRLSFQCEFPIAGAIANVRMTDPLDREADDPGRLS